MCLTSKWRFPKKTKDTITCYKVLEKFGSNYSTPYQDTEVDISKPLIAKGISFTLNPFANNMKSRGYIHTYSKLASAVMSASLISKTCVIFKCCIPKDIKYHISYDESEYCSKEINFIELIPSYIIDKMRIKNEIY